MILYTLKKVKNRNPGSNPGFYFLAKKKNFKQATERNRAKRIARHAFQRAYKDAAPTLLGIKNSGTSIVFILERGIIQESFLNIVKNLYSDLINLK